MSGKAPVVTGNAHPNIYPYDVFQSGTKPVFLAIGNNGQFRRLCAAIGAPELSDDPLYADNGLRPTNRGPRTPSIEAKLDGMAGYQPCTRLPGKQVPPRTGTPLPDMLRH